MTTFSYPANIRRGEPGASNSVENASVGKIPFHLIRRITVSDTGGAVGTTTIPLFIAPAGSRPFDCVVDVVTGYNQTNASTFVRVGTAANPTCMLVPTTVNTAGRREIAETAAQVSINDIVYAVDTTIQAVVSIETSTVTAGDIIITGIFR
jgi:hypothetical protein